MEINHFLLLPFIILFDAMIGEVRQYHPLVGFGHIANTMENYLNNNRVKNGVLAWLLLILPPFIITWALSSLFGWCFELVIGYLALGAKSLWQHAQPIQQALQNNDLKLARKRLSWIVSRNTASLNEEEISKATVESLLENGSDAIFATLFWFAVAGAEGALLYRLSNTLDAMWGYKNKRYYYFGYFAARVDDILNWIPARLTALSYSLYGDTKSAWQCWQQQGSKWYSPNAGPVMASGAGALNITLGGAAFYDGVLKLRIILGKGDTATAKDIHRAWLMIRTIMIYWSMIALILGVILLILRVL